MYILENKFTKFKKLLQTLKQIYKDKILTEREWSKNWIWPGSMGVISTGDGRDMSPALFKIPFVSPPLFEPQKS